ncbi:MAG: aminotransferase class V-fold PLP-dependent enzyme, partial [Rhodothalassiaceae bacterium]
FHCDAAQALGKVPLDVEAMKIDLMSLSAHKIYGPKGIGALYVRRARPRVRLVPQMSGGGQEGGIRSGTLAPALCAGFGTALRIAAREMAAETARLAALMERFRERLLAAHPGIVVNGDLVHRYPGNLNLGFPGLDGERLLAELPELALSSGAACASATSGPSYVLEAIGRSPALARSSLRIGIGRFTTAEEMAFAAERIIAAVSRLGGIRAAGTTA